MTDETATAPPGGDEPTNFDLLLDIPLEVTVEIGRTRLAIRDLLQLGAGSVVERTVWSGDYTHIPAIRRAPDGRLYLYAVSVGVQYEHVSEDDGLTWSRTPIETMGRTHGHPSLPCAPETIATAGAVSSGPFYVYTRTLAPEPGAAAQTLVALVALAGLARTRSRRCR